VNLANLQNLWEREEAAYLKRMDNLRQKHIAVILVVAEQDRAWLERVNAIQEEQRKVTDYWLAEQKKTADAIHAAQLKRLEQITDDIRKDAARAYCGKFMRCMRSWKRGSERKLSILRSALKKYGRSGDLSWYAFSRNSKALSLSPNPAWTVAII
jgi:superfamily I DNA and/or RNA helicase